MIVLNLTENQAKDLVQVFDLALKGLGMGVIKQIFHISLELQRAYDKFEQDKTAPSVETPKEAV